jgi:hypothetical protein
LLTCSVHSHLRPSDFPREGGTESEHQASSPQFVHNVHSALPFPSPPKSFPSPPARDPCPTFSVKSFLYLALCTVAGHMDHSADLQGRAVFINPASRCGRPSVGNVSSERHFRHHLPYLRAPQERCFDSRNFRITVRTDPFIELECDLRCDEM